MKNKLRLLFEYQRFSPNSRLSEMIEATENRRTSLSDEDLMMVAAAGEINSGLDAETEKTQKDE